MQVREEGEVEKVECNSGRQDTAKVGREAEREWAKYQRFSPLPSIIDRERDQTQRYRYTVCDGRLCSLTQK